MQEKTLIIIKPDAIYRGISHSIIERIENAGFCINAMKIKRISKEEAERHYEEHVGREYYERLINFILSGPVILLVVEGPDAIKRMRAMSGKTIAEKRVPGSIRGDLSLNNLFNLIHSSDSIENSKREINIFFDNSEILEYDIASKKFWVF